MAVGLLACAVATQATAGVSYVDLGTGAPASMLGAYSVLPFPNDNRAEDTEVNFAVPPASAPVTGNLEFSSPLLHYEVGSGFATWSHGYGGDVYLLDEIIYGNSLTLTLPTDTKAFYFYLQPNFFGELEFAVASDALSNPSIGNVLINGDGGARGFGFYSDASDLLSITIRGVNTDPDGFAVGQFGINGIPGTPDGGISVGLFGLVLVGIGALRRRVQE